MTTSVAATAAATALPAGLLRNQIAASDPAVSAWVSANAGSGKTYVLAQRVIRLLLDGVDPAKILCLTFTKAAAANMANRVFETLASWTALDDAALDGEIGKIEGRAPSTQRRLRARRLFAEALETPGGLKVQTIHAFCTALLHQFPFEADVAARFEVLEERAEAELIDSIRLGVLLDAAGAPETPLGRALAAAIVEAADTTFANVVREAVGQRDALEAWIARAGGVEAALAELAGALGVAPDDTLAQVDAEFLVSPHLPQRTWPAIMKALAKGGKTDQEHIARFAAASAGTAWENIEAWLRIFCTTQLEPRKTIITKPVREAQPELAVRMSKEQARLGDLLIRRRAIALRDRTAALVTIADAVLSRYRAEKERRGLLDYDDLIEKTLKLLSGDGSANWVMYKLDLGIDHVLIDEAQDTSPRQWEVVRRLTAEFTAGAGARSAKRSIFAVGDEKQSIYSFQGAAPEWFDRMRAHFERAHNVGGLAFERVPLTHSFRSSPDVLEAVDAVFRRPEAFEGLTAQPEHTVHEAVRRKAPGFVELWPLIEPTERPEVEPWDAPFDTPSGDSPQVRLAQRIASAVDGMIARGERVGDEGQRRALTPGDILVLVRQRGALFEAIIRALKEHSVDVAGADRLVLNEHIAVMDLLSLADALLLPQDDLALAEVLKSPLFGLDDDLLFVLAFGRKGSLRAALRAKAGDNRLLAAAAEDLDRLERSAREATPFAFYADLLGAGGGRRKFLARLGLEAADALDEFLALALDYESRHTPSLQGFVAWVRSAQADVKRDMDIVRDEVRVMTVHGAKGLEAPVVILADTTTRPAGPRDPPLLRLPRAGDPPETAAAMVWRGSKAGDVPAVAEARAAARLAAEREHRRLLYVAMTRAADRLIVCGAVGGNGKPAGCWYDLVHDALRPDAREMPAADGQGVVWRWRKGPPGADEAGGGAAGAAVPPPPAPPAPPGWLSRAVPAAAPVPQLIAPSAAFEGAGPRPAQAHEAARRARARGTAMHRLLQSLPDVAVEQRAERARAFLRRAAGDFSDNEREAMLGQVLALLADAAFAPLFAPGTMAEAPIVGRVRRGDGAIVPVAGRIDRMAVGADSVLIADFKTDRFPPRRPEDVPVPYRAQLALYRALLGRLYPGRKIRAALVFTETVELIELPAALLDAALVHLDVTAP